MKRTRDQLIKDIGQLNKVMLEKLEQNNHKSYWNETSITYLFNRLQEEVLELQDAIKNYFLCDEKDLDKYKRNVLFECADVANFAMMITVNLNNIAEFEKLTYNKIKE